MKLFLVGILMSMAATSAGCATTSKAGPGDEGRPAEAEQTASSDTFHSAMAGFSMKKPSSWHFASGQLIVDHRAGIQMRTEKLAEALRMQPNVPLVTVIKHAEPYPTLNATFSAGIRNAGQYKGVPPTELLKGVSQTMQQMTSDMKVIIPVEETLVSGLPAAHTKFSAKVKTQTGEQYPILSHLWIVPRGDFLFVLSTGGPPSGPDVSEAEFDAMMASVKIEP